METLFGKRIVTAVDSEAKAVKQVTSYMDGKE